MKLPAYPRTKPSGVEWLGDVPEHWGVSCLKHSVNELYSGGTPESGNSEYWANDDEESIAWVSIGDMTRDALVKSTEKRITRAGLASKRLRILPTGTLLYSMYASLGKVAVLGIPATVNQAILGIVPDSRKSEQSFLRYWLIKMENHLELFSSSNTQDNLNAGKVRALPLVVPPPAEQRSIAAFLDRETGRVDRLVAKKRELIERLKEKRTALISRTVTRGLPPAAARAAGLPENPPFKPSGHPWLDDIPKHWEVKRLKEVSVLFGRIGFRGYSTDDLVYEGEGAISMSPSNMADGVVSLNKCTWLSWEKYHESPEIQVQPDDVIMVKTGSTLGKTAFVQSVPVPMTVNPQLMIFKEVKCSKRFLFYYVFSNVVQDVIPLHNTGSTIPTMTQEGIGKLPFPHPPLPEQAAIAAYLDGETAKLDALVGKVEEAVERLQEYRTALITAAVTGKIDVRKETHG